MPKMPPAAYEAMKRRLRELLQEWGIWTDAELEKVAAFVEREAALHASQAKVELKEQAITALVQHNRRRKN